MLDEGYLRQLGIGVASLTFGVALAIFIHAAASGIVNSMQALLLFLTSFLLMLRFWWRYTELFTRFLPSKGYWHFLLDFMISFFGISAVLFLGNIQTWAALGVAAMIASMMRCLLSRKDAKDDKVRLALRRTLLGSVIILIVMSVIYLLAPFVSDFLLAATALILVVVFIAYASIKA